MGPTLDRSETGETTHRQILRSSSIIGGASAANILVGLLKAKVAAMLLGPAGVGLIGLLTNVMATAATLGGLGIGNVGTRQIAEAESRHDASALAAARRALFWGTLVLATAGAALFWLLREPIARRVLSGSMSPDAVGWLAIGIALTIASVAQNAVLNGLRRIGDLARVNVLGSLLSTALGIGILWYFGAKGLLAFVLVGPLATFVVGHVFVSRMPRVSSRAPFRLLVGQWTTLIRLGVAFMIAGLAGTAAQLFVRSLVRQRLGEAALGYFHASWVISMTYVGFVLGAMAADFYPRLTAGIGDHARTNRLINQQVEVALLLAGPVILLTLALSPWVIQLLYASSFAPAAAVLRWQVMGDVLKIASWPLGFLILAAGDGRAYLLSETAAMGVFATLSVVGVPRIGIEATGLALLATYAFYLPLVHLLARRRTAFRWDPPVRRLLMALFLLAASVVALASWHQLPAALFGVIAAGLFGLHALRHLSRMSNIDVLSRMLGARGPLAWLRRAFERD